MIEISWKKFETKHPKATDAFESMCYFLFCRKYGINDGIRTDFNQVGLETELLNILMKILWLSSKILIKILIIKI